MGTVRSINSIDQFENTESLKPGYNTPVVEAEKSLVNNLSEDSPENKEKMKAIDAFQLALDVAWFEPTYGTIADIINVCISTFRSILATESDERKRHIINAGISAISIIPFADVIKLLKLRKTPKLAKAAIKWARVAKNYAKREKIKWDRFTPPASSSNATEKQTKEIYLDPYQSMAEDEEYYAKAA